MKSLSFLFLVFGLVLANGAWDKTVTVEPGTFAEGEFNGFCLIELYTSEGCSSCPPADDLLSTIAKKAEEKRLPVYALAFHVDYWDYIGWKDPFAKKSFAERQRKYGNVLKLKSVYTPQMIVNGATEFVGSDKKAAAAAMDVALRSPRAGEISLRARRLASDTIAATYHLDALPKNAIVCLAVTESGLQSAVRRGENKGRTLRHDCVVREFVVVDMPQKDVTVKIPFRNSGKDDKLRCVAFIQNFQTMTVFAAAQARVEPR